MVKVMQHVVPAALLAAYLGFGVLASAQTDPAALPARDLHQGLLVAVNPYVSAAPSKAKFGKHAPYDGGVLALDVYFRNDNDSPIRIDLETVDLRIGAPGNSRQKLPAISAEDVADRILLKAPRQPGQSRLPRPLPGSNGKTGRDKEWQEFDGVLRSAAMSTEVLPPHMVTHGFFYFDIDARYDWLTNASFDVSDLQFMTTKQALLFFEIALSPASH
jgi:hypothetical protein